MAKAKPKPPVEDTLPHVPALLSAEEFARQLCVKVRQVRYMIAQSDVEVVRIGRLVRIPKTELARLMAAARREDAPPF